MNAIQKLSSLLLVKTPVLLGSALLLSSTSVIAAQETTRNEFDGASFSAPVNTVLSTENQHGSDATFLEGSQINTAVEVAQTPLRQLVNNRSRQKESTIGQLTSVDQLRDVSPGSWAYEALRNLVENYGCIVGYPDLTYRGTRSLSRWEFAAGLNACLTYMERLIQENVALLREDIDLLKRLAQEFEVELAALGARVDNLEARVSFLEDHQFSTTTKLQGEVVFNLGQAFGGDIDNLDEDLGDGIGGGVRDIGSQVAFSERIRLQFRTSFTGKDVLYTRLTGGSIANSFQDETETFEGRYAYDGQADNDIIIDRLHYYFPIGDKLKIFAQASLGGHHFYVDTFNQGLEAGGGATGSLTRFFERNPIYRFGLGGQGVGATYKASDLFELSAGYLARGGFDPSDGQGLFNGNYSILGQIVIKPTDRLKFGLTYLNNYDPGTSFSFGATGTQLANFNNATTGLLSPVAFDDGVSSNAYGIEGKFDATDWLSIRAFGSYVNAKLIGLGTADLWTYGLILAFPDLGKEGNIGYVGFGAEPYLASLSVPAAATTSSFSNDVPFHVEAAYKYQLTDGIAITPGVTVLTAPNQDSDNNDVIVIGTVRTTFTF